MHNLIKLAKRAGISLLIAVAVLLSRKKRFAEALLHLLGGEANLHQKGLFLRQFTHGTFAEYKQHILWFATPLRVQGVGAVASIVRIDLSYSSLKSDCRSLAPPDLDYSGRQA